jgi:polyisoprenoid-binding protein YceI
MHSPTFVRWVPFLLITLSPLAAADRPLALDSATSRVEIDVKATVDSFTATLPVYQAAIQVDGQPLHVTTASFRFHFADIKTGKSDRDGQMNAWQQSEKFPDGAFTLTSLTPATGGANAFNATGTLQLHGVTRALTFPVTISTGTGGRVTIDGAAPFDTRDFGLPIIRKFALFKVDPHVTVRFHLAGNVSAP